MLTHNRRIAGAVLFVAFAAVAIGVAPGTLSRASAQVPLPNPSTTPTPGPIAPEPSPLPTALPTETVTPTPAPRHGKRRAAPTATPGATSQPAPTPTPTSPAFSTLDGNWEVQVQSLAGTAYSRFAVHQDGSSVVGTWYVNGKQLPFTGSYDGRLFRFIVKGAPDPKNAPSDTLNLTGYIENSTDMVGIVDNGKGDAPGANPLAFTAEHRAPYKPGFLSPRERPTPKPTG